MRVQMTQNSKEIFKVSEMPEVRKIIADLKNDEYTLEEYAKMAVNEIGNTSKWEIYRTKAEMAKNCRITNYYTEHSGNADVWITFLAFNNYEGAYDCGVYLSDLWQLTVDNCRELKDKMYVNAFTKNDR